MSKLTIKTAEELRHIHADQAVYGGSEARQYAWERGQIDYMGEDAFANIQKKLDSAMTAAEPPIAEGAHQEKKAGDKQASGTKTPPSSKSKKHSKKWTRCTCLNYKTGGQTQTEKRHEASLFFLVCNIAACAVKLIDGL